MQEVGPVVWVGGEWVWSQELNDWVYVPVLKPIPNSVLVGQEDV